MELGAEVEEELESLRAIFSDELVLEEHRPHTAGTQEHEGQGSVVLIFRLQGRRDRAWACLMEVCLRVPHYPLCCPPTVIVTPQDGITRAEVCRCLMGLQERLDALQGAPAVHEVVCWVHDRLDEVREEEEEEEEETQSQATQHSHAQAQAQASEGKEKGRGRGWVALVLIDHMNRPKAYTAVLQEWARELQLDGVLALLCGSVGNVYVLLHGPDKQAVQEWLKRLRTHKVDVDSRGRACRERMASVLLMQEAPLELQLQDKEWQGRGLVVQEGLWQQAQHFLQYAKDQWHLPL